MPKIIPYLTHAISVLEKNLKKVFFMFEELKKNNFKFKGLNLFYLNLKD